MSTYRHSGRFSVGGLLAGLFAGITAGVVLSFVYAYAIVYIPVVGIFTFLLALGFGALVGLAAGTTMRSLKVRSNLGLLVAFAATLVAFWASWVVWVYAIVNRADVPLPMAPLVLSPGFLWDTIVAINADGAWSLKSWTPKGTVLWVFWGVEAALIFGGAWLASAGALSDPFCEACDSWCSPVPGVLAVTGTERAQLRERVEAKDLAWVASLGAVSEGALEWFRFDLFECGCRKTCTLNLNHVTLKIEKGKAKEESSSVLSNLLVTAEETDAVRGIAARFASA